MSLQVDSSFLVRKHTLILTIMHKIGDSFRVKAALLGHNQSPKSNLDFMGGSKFIERGGMGTIIQLTI